MELQSKDAADVRLVLMTPEEDLAQHRANCAEWSGALNQEQYLRREKFLADQEITRNGGLTAWALVHQPNGAETRQVLAGCETYKKKALVLREGKVQDVIAHGVGSVFCPPEFRGHGYAGRMMKDLGERLKTWNTAGGEEVLCSVLYSDIGKKFYAARGWQAFPSAHIALAPSGKDQSELPEVRSLKAEDLSEVCRIDQDLLRARMAKRDSDEPAVAILPDSATVQWHHAREDFVANEVYGKAPTIKGAVAGSEGSRVWCYWTRIFADPTKEPHILHVLRVVVEDEQFSDFAPASDEPAQELKDSSTAKNIAAVFAAAQRQAEEWKVKEVQIWNPTSMTLAAAQLLDANVAVVHRNEESIASLLWYGKGSWQDVDWILNEKYGWC